MNKDNIPPPYEYEAFKNLLYDRQRAISDQPAITRKQSIQHIRGMSADPCHSGLETGIDVYSKPLYPAIEEIEEEIRLVQLNAPNRHIIPLIAIDKVELKEIWEAGLGIHTGLLKGLKKRKDVGGETNWKKADIQIINGELKVEYENHKTYSHSLKYASLGLDKISDRKHGLYLQLVNGKTIKISYKDRISLQNGYQMILREITQG